MCIRDRCTAPSGAAALNQTWERDRNSGIVDAGPPFAQTSPPLSTTTTGGSYTSRAPKDLIGKTASILDWGLIVYPTNGESCTTPRETLLSIDVTGTCT